MKREPTCVWVFILAACLGTPAFVDRCTAADPNAAEPATTEPTSALATPHDAILREIRDFTRAGMDRRLGPDYASFHKQAKEDKFPQIYLAPVKPGPNGRSYQIGGPWAKEAGDYSSTQGQVLYASDQGFGVDRVTIIEWTNGCFTEAPLPPWWGGFRPEPAAKKWQEAAGGKIGSPIAMARGMGSWANCGVAIFSSGLVGTAGTCTGIGSLPTFRFPPGKIPTAVSMTNKNEFALVTLHDVQAKKGQVAVLAMTSSNKNFVHEWPEDYPGLPNVAVYSGIKLLGYVDLPGMEFPTGVCAVGNREGGRVNAPDGNAGVLKVYDLSQQSARDVFLKGGNAEYSCTTGFAVVISKHANKAAFLDLQPLFERMRKMYFTTPENFRKTRDMGPGAKWPPTFEADPTWKPPVVKVLSVRQPTAVLASMSGGDKARAFIASQDGKVGIYAVGGLATDAPASAVGVGRLGEVQVGRNPTCLAYQKGSHDTFIACSRGDREIAWVKYADRGATVVRRLRDARLLDPVYVEVSDTHGVETAILTVADFKGRKIMNYRYGVVTFATQGGAKFGMGKDGKDEFECGGVLELPGCPFCLSATNVN
jgi:hypothetical protein